MLSLVFGLPLWNTKRLILLASQQDKINLTAVSSIAQENHIRL